MLQVHFIAVWLGIFWGYHNCSLSALKVFDNIPIVPNLNLPNCYHSHTQYFLLIADMCTDQVHGLKGVYPQSDDSLRLCHRLGHPKQ